MDASPQRIPNTLNSEETKRTLMDMDISMRSMDCDYTVQFYGALFQAGSAAGSVGRCG